MTFNKTFLTAALVTLGGFAAMSANATGTEKSTFGVTVEIDSVCTVDASGGAIDFSKLNAAATADATIVAGGNILVTCSKNAPYVINLKSGHNSTNTSGAGIMKHSTSVAPEDVMTYQLYSIADGSKTWGGDGTLLSTGTAVSSSGSGLSIANEHPVFAKLTGTADVKLGEYSDIVTASVIY